MLRITAHVAVHVTIHLQPARQSNLDKAIEVTEDGGSPDSLVLAVKPAQHLFGGLGSVAEKCLSDKKPAAGHARPGATKTLDSHGCGHAIMVAHDDTEYH